MLKSKVKFITITFLIFVISFAIAQNNYGKCLEEVTNGRVVITSDTKELKSTQEIKFQVEENKNVVRGKIAPGLKAKATIEIDFSEVYQTMDMADIQIEMDDSNLADCFQLTMKLNDETYKQETIQTIALQENNRVQELVLELEWFGKDDELDTWIGSRLTELKVPVTIYVAQHI